MTEHKTLGEILDAGRHETMVHKVGWPTPTYWKIARKVIEHLGLIDHVPLVAEAVGRFGTYEHLNESGSHTTCFIAVDDDGNEPVIRPGRAVALLKDHKP